MNATMNDKILKSTARTLVAGLGASYGTGFILGKLADRTLDRPLFQLDGEVGLGINRRSNSGLDLVMRVASAAGEPWILYPLSGLVALRWLAEDRGADSTALALAVTGSAAVNKLIKLSVNRPRPRFMLRRSKSSGSAFPSNHILMSVATYGAIAHLWTRKQKKNSQSANKQKKTVSIWTPVLLLCALMSASRVYAGVHHPSDVLGGWAVGAVWLATCAAIRNHLIE